MAESDLTELADGLDRAVDGGYLPNPAVNPWAAAVSRNAADSRSYIWALRTRMIALGYLGAKGNRESDVIDPTFVNAIRRFQRDIGDAAIVQDGWAGPQTWGVLQSLVSFEESQDPTTWQMQTDFDTSPAVARAAYLRLWVMGFFDDWQQHRLKRGVDITLGNEHFVGAYRRFWAFARRLGLTDAVFAASLDRSALAVLFGHDSIVEALGSERFDDMAEFSGQVEAIARIELWLHGYDCQPGPPNKRTRRRRRGNRFVRQRVSTQKQAVENFWRDNDEPDGHSGGVTQLLFSYFSPDPATPVQDDVQFDQVIARIDTLKEDETESFVERLQSVASTIWDGAKRLAKSIWRFLSRIGRAVGSMLKNLARFVARHARRYFHLVVRAVDVVQGGIDYLRHTSFPRQLPSRVIIHRGADFDHSLLLKPGCTIDDSPAFSTYRLLAAQFSAGCLIVGKLLNLLREVATIAAGSLAGPLFWLRSLLAIGKIRGFVEEVADALQVLDGYRVVGEYDRATMRFDIA